MMRSSSRGSRWSPLRTGDVELFYPGLRTMQFFAGAPDTLEIPNQFPLQALLFKIEGTVTVAGAAATVADNPFHLLEDVELKLVNENRINLTGKRIRRMMSYQKRYAPAVEDGELSHVAGDTLAIGTHKVFSQVYVPWDSGAYDSLFAAMRHNPAKLQIKFGQVADVFTAGGGGTVSFAGQLKVIPEFITGFPDGVPGGNEVANKFKYMDRFYVSEELNLKNTTEVIFDLPTGRFYDQLLFECTDENGDAVTDLLKSYKFEKLRGTSFDFPPEEAQVLAGQHAEWPYAEDGVYEPPFLMNQNPDTILNTFGNKGGKYRLTLNRVPNDGEKIVCLQSYLVGGLAGLGRARPIPGE